MTDIDAIRINFNPDQLLLLNLCLAFLVFGVALDLRVDQFRQLYRQPKAAFVGLTSQLILLPLLTMLLIYLLRPAASIALGMILVAACPGGNVSNYAVHLSGANAALSVVMTSISTLAAIVLTPLYFLLLAPLVPGTEALQGVIQLSPWQMIGTIIQLVVVPLSIGMMLNHRYPTFTEKIKRPVRWLSMTIFLGFVVVAIYSNFGNIYAYLHLVFLIVLLHNTLALLMGYHFARWNALSVRDARAIAIETGIQNSGLGLILIFNFFAGLGGMAMIAAWWGIWHLISAFTLAIWWSRSPQITVARQQ